MREVGDKWTGHEFGAGGERRLDYEVRHYGADDPKGEYQLWCNGRYRRDYTEDMKQKAAETQAAARQAVKMQTLLMALNTLG